MAERPFALASKMAAKMSFAVGQSQLQQGLRESTCLAAARQASAEEPFYDRHDSAVMAVNDSAVIGG
ncbi:hypothetical protein [Dyella sp. AtDHG13]|uniref:hypothetical protein n=1 Tax=Dyella sp. AtDHG13 TaxID=1938897 RepID=UPI001F48134A|nr:hypothetical protein [Dyella sp. AtDHG13]